MQEILLWLQTHPVLLPAVCRLLTLCWMAEVGQGSILLTPWRPQQIYKHPHNFPIYVRVHPCRSPIVPAATGATRRP